MSTFRILLATGDDGEESVDSITVDLNAAINNQGLLGGNFLVEKIADDEDGFWAEWARRAELPYSYGPDSVIARIETTSDPTDVLVSIIDRHFPRGTP